MRVLVLGRGSLTTRRLLPALGAMPDVRHTVAELARHDLLQRAGDVIAAARPDLVYISTANHLHYPLARQALEAGRHVVVDKPLALSLQETLSLDKAAAARGLLLAEATVWPFHPKVRLARRILIDKIDEVRHLSATFTFPRLPESNYRHRPELGGGMLADLGPYAVSAARVFIGSAATHVAGSAETLLGDAVESTFTMTAAYEGGRTLAGHFGMGRPYMNQVVAMGGRTILTIGRIFANLPDEPAPVLLSDGSGHREYRAEPADVFVTFLRAAFEAIAAGRPAAFREALLSDAAALDGLRRATRPFVAASGACPPEPDG